MCFTNSQSNWTEQLQYCKLTLACSLLCVDQLLCAQACNVDVFCVWLETANAEDLFGDADDISSVSSHGDEECAEADAVCSSFVEPTFAFL